MANLFVIGNGFDIAHEMEVDKPYIKMLCNCLNTAKITWVFHSFNSLKERQSFQQTLIECGFAGKFDSFDA